MKDLYQNLLEKRDIEEQGHLKMLMVEYHQMYKEIDEYKE